ncbi:MAG: Prephenate dehydratase [Candidatus Methanogaster sp.]|nr:MAG: Prephenate dehydratase [ANME-2 cluster archaeon]
MKIVGVGAGRNLLTTEAIDTIENASVVYGSKRAIELAKDHIRCDYHEIKDYKRISELPDGAVVLSTGDPMLSGLGRFAKAGDAIVPGISSMQVVSARLKIEQTELAAVTAHARDINRAKELILTELELGKTVFVLPDARFNLQEVSKLLLDRGFAIPVAVCEHVAYPDERIAIGTTENPPEARADLFSIVIGSAINRGDRKITIGVLGPAGTFSEQAAKRWSTAPEEFVYFSDVDEIVASVGNRIDFGVVPVENSLEGSVGATLDALLKHNVTIVGEIILPIQHSLLAKSETAPIKTIISHPQATAQCKRFLQRHFGDAEIQVAASTAHAAELASGEEGVAAIASADTALRYGLKILFEEIQDVDENHTRFIVLGTTVPPTTGQDKTSIIVDLHKDRPGALHELLGKFSSWDINLTKIESRPTRKALGDYLFYIDFQGHIHDGKIRDVMQSIEGMVARLKVLGSYRQAVYS